MSHGDFLPTLAPLTGVEVATEHGQDAFGGGYSVRRQFFLKTAAPSKAGVLDGNDKYIMRMDGTEEELLNITDETTPVTSQRPARAAELRRLVLGWVEAIHCDWLDQLEGYADELKCGGQAGMYVNVREQPAGVPWARRMAMACWPDGEQLRTIPIVHPTQRPLGIHMEWVEIAVGSPIVTNWLTPNGTRVHSQSMHLQVGWHSTKMHWSPKRPLEQGNWTVEVRCKKTDAKIAHVVMPVESSAPVCRMMAPLRLRESMLLLGGEGATRVNPRQASLTVRSRWYPVPNSTDVTYNFGPAKEKPVFTGKLTLKQGWDKTQYTWKPGGDLAAGQWRAVVRKGGQELGSVDFVVDPAAPLIGKPRE